MRFLIFYLLVTVHTLSAQNNITQQVFFNLPVDSTQEYLEKLMAADTSRFGKWMVYNGLEDSVTKKAIQIPYFYFKEKHSPYLPKPFLVYVRFSRERSGLETEFTDYLLLEELHDYKISPGKIKEQYKELQGRLQADYDSVSYAYSESRTFRQKTKDGNRLYRDGGWTTKHYSTLFYSKVSKRPRLILTWSNGGKHNQSIEIKYRKTGVFQSE
jgi:hypothetical protein